MDTTSETYTYWKLRESGLAFDLRAITSPLADVASWVWANGLLQAVLVLLALDRDDEVPAALARVELIARVVLREIEPPEPPTRRLPNGPLEWAQAGQALVFTRWLASGVWDREAALAAAEALEEHYRGRFMARDHPWLLRAWLAAGCPERAIAAYERNVNPRKWPAIPPPDKRFVNSQLNALYVIARFQAGETALAPFAEAACLSWVGRIHRWEKGPDSFQWDARLFWALLWSACFGGPEQPREVMRALRGY